MLFYTCILCLILWERTFIAGKAIGLDVVWQNRRRAHLSHKSTDGKYGQRRFPDDVFDSRSLSLISDSPFLLSLLSPPAL
ncbi:hypothetical protein A3841_06110 [Pontibacter flavimaris]|uniref:Uncharacterized protein n=1 Tax=Pontibacter flavimaris TaxID=1797110 RepID=A0A1Q5P8Z5_9BACT|nr:hypothetical protein A3841_06110 [Pontibacter flavimaris]